MRDLVWPIGIVAGFVVAAGVHAVLIVAAVRNPPVLESKDYYEQGLAYQRVIDAEQASAALGWSAAIEPCAAVTPDGCTVEVSLADPAGAPVRGLAGVLRAIRPDDAALDDLGAFEEVSAGLYRAQVRVVRPGTYRLEMQLGDDDRRWVRRHRAWLSGPGA